jgi:two-component system cell cycle sensor histidine kinase/response regulator CckA
MPMGIKKLCQKIAELESEKQKLEENLRASEERFFEIFHATSNPMAITSIKEGRIVDMNEAIARFSGFERQELLGRTSEELHLWPDLSKRDMIVAQLQAEGKIHNMQVELSTKADGPRTTLFSANLITLNDEPCCLSALVDITARERETQALRQSEEKYRSLVENSIQGLAIIKNSRFVFCNNAFAEMLGYSVEELLALSSREVDAMVHPDDRASVRERYRARLAGKPVPSRYEHRAIKKDGTECWLEAHAAVIEYNGKPAMQTAYVDITERKKAENALRQSEERFRQIAESIDEVFWICDLDRKAFVYLSPAFDRIFGYPRELFYDGRKPVRETVHPDDREKFISMFAVMKSGQPLDYEHRIIRPDNSMRHLWIRGFPVPDETGQIKRYAGVTQDVTAWRSAQEELKQSREYLNQIINCIADPIFVKDDQHRFLLINDAFCAFCKIPKEELLGKTDSDLLPKHVADSIWEMEEVVYQTGKESETEDNLADGRGDNHVVMVKKALLTDKKGGKQIVGVIRDITEHKRLEAQFMQSQKMEAVGVLAGGIAHDFNNLISVIKGYTEILMENLPADDRNRPDLEQIEKASQRAIALTTQLLAFSRKQRLKPEVLNLNTAVIEMSTMLRRLIGEDIELVTIAEPDLGLISADPGQIQQIIMNIAANARDAMPHGGRFTIETSNATVDEDYAREHPNLNPGPYVMMAISDNGSGMDAATQARIFEPFFTTKGKGKGTGLGLSTVYGIVKQSNGFVWVYSELGKGTTFKIYFPQLEEGRATQPAEGQPEAATAGGETVLIAEDESSVRALAARVLREQGYTVLEAPDGMEALRVARERSGEIDLVLTDVVMPRISGTELVSQIEAMKPGVKALYLSGYTDGAVVHHGLLDSKVAFLQKPFTVENLARKVREVIES